MPSDRRTTLAAYLACPKSNGSRGTGAPIPTGGRRRSARRVPVAPRHSPLVLRRPLAHYAAPLPPYRRAPRHRPEPRPGRRSSSRARRRSSVLLCCPRLLVVKLKPMKTLDVLDGFGCQINY
jgi:hypothetical protein